MDLRFKLLIIENYTINLKKAVIPLCIFPKLELKACCAQVYFIFRQHSEQRSKGRRGGLLFFFRFGKKGLGGIYHLCLKILFELVCNKFHISETVISGSVFAQPCEWNMSDMEEDEDYGFEYETDDDEEQDVDIENQVCQDLLCLHI